jgi:hypothetical protein
MGLFSRKVYPSREAMRAAALLGQEMAKREFRLIPHLAGASRYTDYRRFVHAHRERLEQTDLFAKWQDQLLELAEIEGKAQRLHAHDSMKAWDLWYAHITTPMKEQMWIAWEAWHDLPALYDAARQTQPALEPAAPPVPRLAVAPESPQQMEVSLPPGRSSAADKASPRFEGLIGGSTVIVQGPTWSTSKFG